MTRGSIRTADEEVLREARRLSTLSWEEEEERRLLEEEAAVRESIRMAEEARRLSLEEEQLRLATEESIQMIKGSQQAPSKDVLVACHDRRFHGTLDIKWESRIRLSAPAEEITFHFIDEERHTPENPLDIFDDKNGVKKTQFCDVIFSRLRR